MQGLLCLVVDRRRAENSHRPYVENGAELEKGTIFTLLKKQAICWPMNNLNGVYENLRAPFEASNLVRKKRMALCGDHELPP